MPIEYDEQKGSFIMRATDNNLWDYFQNKGFLFSRAILAPYFLSLKTKPFVRITGIPRTGGDREKNPGHPLNIKTTPMFNI
jgi:hypothetical protein